MLSPRDTICRVAPTATTLLIVPTAESRRNRINVGLMTLFTAEKTRLVAARPTPTGCDARTQRRFCPRKGENGGSERKIKAVDKEPGPADHTRSRSECTIRATGVWTCPGAAKGGVRDGFDPLSPRAPGARGYLSIRATMRREMLIFYASGAIFRRFPAPHRARRRIRYSAPSPP